MYGYINGKITDIEASYVILENNGIGYLIYVPNPYGFMMEREYTIYTYTKVAEDEYTLYGFKTKEEKELFLKLISVKGLGPKMALPMLATGSISMIEEAIETENINYLKMHDLFDLLEENTRIVADARVKYPEVSMQELADIITLENNYKIGKSGVNHHFIKIAALVKRHKDSVVKNEKKDNI